MFAGAGRLLPISRLFNEYRVSVARRVNNAENSYLAVCGTIENDVLADRNSADVRPLVRLEAPADQGKPSQQPKSAGDGFNVARCDLWIATFARDIEPDFVKVGTGLRRETYAHQRSERRAAPRS